MAYALVANVKMPGNGANGGTTAAVNTTGADFIVAGVPWLLTGTFSNPTDSKGNTYTGLTGRNNGTVGARLFYVANPTVGTLHTFSVAGTNAFEGVYVQAWSGSKLTSPFDVENGASQVSGTTLATGSVTPTENDEVVVTFMTSQATGTVSINGGFTISDSQNTLVAGTNFAGGMAYLVQTTAAAANPTWTAGSATATAIATFKVAPATGTARSYGYVFG